MNKYFHILVLVVLTGCSAFSHKPVTEEDPVVTEKLARAALENGEYYRARKMIQELLSKEPDKRDYQTLMAEVLEKEISEQKEAFESKVPEEWNSEERKTQAMTWLERSEELLRRGEYEQAYEAAEKVFIYDPENMKASEVMDRIRKQAEKDGKSQRIFVKEMYRNEAQIRVGEYKEQVQMLIEKERWGKAKLTVEKIMLLDPKDKEALKLYEEISQHSEAGAA